MDVLDDLAEMPEGRSFFGLIPRLQRFIVEKYSDEFKFKHEDLNIQSEDVIQLISQKVRRSSSGMLSHHQIQPNQV